MINQEEIHDFVYRPVTGSWYYRHYTELRNALFVIMWHGVRYDRIMAASKSQELKQHKKDIKANLLKLTNGTALWAEKSRLSDRMLDLRNKVKDAKAYHNSIPKDSKQARKDAKAAIALAQANVKECTATGENKAISWGSGLSDDKIADYLYNVLKLPAIKKRRKETNKVTITADVTALKKLRIKYPEISELIRLILEHRKCDKLLQYCNEGLCDSDGRIRTMYKPFGTQSGRLSSSSNPLGGGTNLQNPDRSLKCIFLPDEG